ncbi:unnamed protein product [Symbiodinium sp. CCMP2592]|nr:unnamed protein product [Symbiodinium sp. CCMP2592]
MQVKHGTKLRIFKQLCRQFTSLTIQSADTSASLAAFRAVLSSQCDAEAYLGEDLFFVDPSQKLAHFFGVKAEERSLTQFLCLACHFLEERTLTASCPSSSSLGEGVDHLPDRDNGRADEGEDERPLTLSTLLAALKDNRDQIVAQVREDIDELSTRVSTVENTVNTRVTTVEHTMDTHVANTTRLLEAMTDRHCAMEQSVRQVDDRQASVLQRLEILEGKFASANFSLSSTRTDSDGGHARPALVVGGWSADQHHEETLRLVKQHIQNLEVDLDTSKAFVPGLRRGFALVPLIKHDGESDEEQRARVQEVLKTIRAAKIITGQRPEGGNRYFFAALSQSPERRKRAQLAGKVKRLIIEEGGDIRHIDVEYGTANLWYNSVKVASGVTSPPEGRRRRGDPEMGQPPANLHVLSWNVGGLTAAKVLECLSALRRQKIRPFSGSLIVAVQEVICDVGKHHDTLDELQIIFGKRDEDWRGTGIVHTSNLQHTRGKILPCSISCTLTSSGLRIGAFSIHLPHHATLSASEQLLQGIHAQVQSHSRAVIGIDANETFSEAQQNRQIKASSARGELLLEWFEEHQCHFPQQEIAEPSHFPYNPRLEPRRLDYVLAKKLLCNPGGVLKQRDIATSDHEPIAVPLTDITIADGPKDRQPAPWSARTLRSHDEVDRIMDHHATAGGDPVHQLQQVAVAITKPGKDKKPFRESDELRQLRRAALLAEPGVERRRLWKQARKLHQSEHKLWRHLAMKKVAELDWGMKKALVEQSRDHSWELGLLEDSDWRGALRLHFEKIFCRQKQVVVTAAIRGIMDKLQRLCKNTPWKPFCMEELQTVKVKWKNGKSCGPDMVSHEALKALLPHPIWGNRLLALFNDMLYTCRIIESVEAGATILLAKTSQPADWSETRPITLSSVLLKTLSQLLLQRAGDSIQTPARLQWCRRGRQGIELIMILRRLARVARDWGMEFYIAKLDIRKAFDSIYQESLAEHVSSAVGEKARLPWEARAWVSLLHAQQINIEIAGESIPIPQSNGVRQGAPESPVAFGSVVAVDLDAAIAEARTSKPAGEDSPPEDGGSYMDDNYIWSTDRKHFQHMLSSLDGRLPRRGLFLHPGKTDIISTSDKETTFKVAGEDVLTNGPKHIFHVLGSPLSFQGGTAMLLAEAQSRARKAFWCHRESFTSDATFRQKLQIHVVLVRQSALWACQTWPCHSNLLRSVNAIQLGQVRTMLGLRRQPCEEWATWNKRSLRRSRLALFHSGGLRWSTFVLSQIWTAVGHICRGDPIGGATFQWHSLRWWQRQKDRGIPVQHAQRFNAYMDIDRQLSETAGPEWFAIAQDRDAWGELEAVFIERYDVPWSSGKQGSIANLDTALNVSETKRASTNSSSEYGRGNPSPDLTPNHNTGASSTDAHQPPTSDRATPSKPEDGSTNPPKPKHIYTAEEQWQYDNAPQGPNSSTLEIPPSIPHAEGTTTEYLPITHGCFDVQVTATHYIPTPLTASAGLPPLHVTHLQQTGPVLTAPPFTPGTHGRLAPMGPDRWLFLVTSVPPLDEFWPHSMFLAEGDSFILEDTPHGWQMTVDKQAASAAREFRRGEMRTPPKAPPQQPTQQDQKRRPAAEPPTTTATQDTNNTVERGSSTPAQGTRQVRFADDVVEPTVRARSKAMQRLASAEHHNYITYYDIQHDVDVVITWLNGHMHAMATAMDGNPQNWGSAAEATLHSYDRGIRNTGEILGRMGQALQGVQMEPQNREHWLLLVDVTAYLTAVESGETVHHPADVIAMSRGKLTNHLARERRERRARGIILELQALREQLGEWRWSWRYNLKYEYHRGNTPTMTRPKYQGTIKDLFLTGGMHRAPLRAGEHGGNKTATTDSEMRPTRAATHQRKNMEVMVKVLQNTGDVAFTQPSTTGTGPSEQRAASDQRGST